MIEEGGLVVSDWSGNRNDGAFQGLVSWATGQFGPALDFGGTNGWVNAGNSSTLEMGLNDQTISLWVNLVNPQPESITGLVCKGAENDTNEGWTLVLDNNSNEIEYRVGNGASRANAILTTANVTDESWHHIAVVVDRDVNTYVYTDGVLRLTTSAPFPGQDITNSGENLQLGRWAGNWEAVGRMDDIRLYNLALSSEEIASLFYDPMAEVEWSYEQRTRRYFFMPSSGGVGNAANYYYRILG